MFKNKRYDPKSNRMMEHTKTVDILPCSYSFNNKIQTEDTPIKLLDKLETINLDAQHVYVPAEIKNQSKESQQTEIQNRKLKQKVSQLNNLLGVQRNMNIQLLKQNNEYLEEIDKMKESMITMQRKIQNFEMAKTLTYGELNSYRTIGEENRIFMRTQNLHNRQRAGLSFNNPEIGPLIVPSLTLEAMTDRNSYNRSLNLEGKRSQSISTIARSKHSIDTKQKRLECSNSLKHGVGVTLLEKRPKSKIIISRKSLYSRY